MYLPVVSLLRVFSFVDTCQFSFSFYCHPFLFHFGSFLFRFFINSESGSLNMLAQSTDSEGFGQVAFLNSLGEIFLHFLYSPYCLKGGNSDKIKGRMLFSIW